MMCFWLPARGMDEHKRDSAFARSRVIGIELPQILTGDISQLREAFSSYQGVEAVNIIAQLASALYRGETSDAIHAWFQLATPKVHSHITQMEGAVYSNNWDVVSHLLDNAFPIDAVLDRSCNTALSIAVCEGHIQMVQKLIERGARVDYRDDEGDSLLLLACLHHKSTDSNILMPMLLILLQGYADAGYVTPHGVPLIFEAPAKAISLLVLYGADTEACDFRGVTALAYALNKGDLFKVLALLEAGANRDTVSVEAVRTKLAEAFQLFKSSDRRFSKPAGMKMADFWRQESPWVSKIEEYFNG